MECLEDIDLKAFLHHVTGKAQSRWSTAYDSHLDTIARCYLRQFTVTMLTLIVGSEALEIANGHSGLVHLQMDTLALALLLLWTDTAADSG